MSRLHRNLTGLSFMSAIALMPLAANAADLYRNPPPPARYVPPAAYVDQNIWQGFYAGLNGGYGWSGNGGAQPQGGFGGGQIGYNFQGGPLVFGLETDFQGGDLSGGITGTTAGGNAFSGNESVDWFGTARGRLGLAFGHALFYGTGGFAYGDVRQSAVYDGVSLGASGTRTGWVAGGGIEYKVNPAWSLKGEYQYIDLGSEKLTDAANSLTTNSLDTSFQTVRLGLNYRFGGSSDPLK
jgi:outer membrane immunogenic protein